ncbi:MAG: hypothetical protein K2G02_09040 [Phocaeicola sp.]|nr:hypothetical protein [Phocaeicola sp.]
MSCVDYAISSVQSAFSNFATDSCINILSFGYNPDLKERIIKKKVFYVAQNDLSSFSAFNQVLPFYLVIDGEKHIISSFIPNMTLPKLTRDYLHNIHSYLSNE